MPSKIDRIIINNENLDKRVKLTADQKLEIIGLKETYSQRATARMFGVSRRTIQFIWFPEKLAENKARRAERGGWKQYYNKEENTKSHKKHRAYKKELFKKDLIKDPKK